MLKMLQLTLAQCHLFIAVSFRFASAESYIAHKLLSDVIMIVVTDSKIATNDVLCYGSELDGPKNTLVTMQGNSSVS